MKKILIVKQLHGISLALAVGIFVFLTGILSAYIASSGLASSHLVRVLSGARSPGSRLNIFRFTPQHQYEVQVFSQDPLILYVHNFLNKYEITHLLKASERKFEPSKVYGGNSEFVDANARVSESAVLEPDNVTRRIRERAERFRGWQGNNSTYIEPLKVQRYDINGFYTFHYDWDELVTEGNRVATFMIYLVDVCTGGGTNFPKLEQPVDARWCSVTECEDKEYPGVTFKPVAGSAIFWENLHTNGSFHKGVRHASLPVKSGEKVGLNIWFWDVDWRPPPREMERLHGETYN